MLETRTAAAAVDAVLRIFLANTAPGCALESVFCVVFRHQLFSIASCTDRIIFPQAKPINMPSQIGTNAMSESSRLPLRGFFVAFFSAARGSSPTDPLPAETPWM
jgi:hypothetical protein